VNDSPAPHASKSELRRRFRALRRGLSAPERERRERGLNRRLLAALGEQPRRLVIAYWPHDGEPDTRPALAALTLTGTTVALPVLGPGDDDFMDFRTWTPGAALAPNRYGIPEPATGAAVDPARADVLLLPLVAWDRDGGRLGMGKAFYDRTLAPLRGAAAPRRIGVAFAFQETRRLAVDPWDVPLHAVVTDEGWFTF